MMLPRVLTERLTTCTTAPALFARMMTALGEWPLVDLPGFSLAGCAAQCRTWSDAYAAQYPTLATDLLGQARVYDAMALKAEWHALALAPPANDVCLHEHVDTLGTCGDCGAQLEAVSAWD